MLLACSGMRSGPVDPSGVLLDVSDRPSMCSAANWGSSEVVIGSSDHALYVVDVRNGKLKRTLYGKQSGHAEWVTCVAFCPDGKVLSGKQCRTAAHSVSRVHHLVGWLIGASCFGLQPGRWTATHDSVAHMFYNGWMTHRA